MVVVVVGFHVWAAKIVKNQPTALVQQLVHAVLA